MHSYNDWYDIQLLLVDNYHTNCITKWSSFADNTQSLILLVFQEIWAHPSLQPEVWLGAMMHFKSLE